MKTFLKSIAASIHNFLDYLLMKTFFKNIVVSIFNFLDYFFPNFLNNFFIYERKIRNIIFSPFEIKDIDFLFTKIGTEFDFINSSLTEIKNIKKRFLIRLIVEDFENSILLINYLLNKNIRFDVLVSYDFITSKSFFKIKKLLSKNVAICLYSKCLETEDFYSTLRHEIQSFKNIIKKPIYNVFIKKKNTTKKYVNNVYLDKIVQNVNFRCEDFGIKKSSISKFFELNIINDFNNTKFILLKDINNLRFVNKDYKIYLYSNMWT